MRAPAVRHPAWRLAAAAALLLAAAAAGPRPAPSPAATPEPAGSAARPREQERLSLDLKGAELADVLRYFATVGRENLVLDPEVQGTVTLRIIEVPWRDAFELILKVHGLWYERHGNILFVAPAARLLQEEERSAELRRRQLEASPLRTVVVRLRYADPTQVAEVLRRIALSERGSVEADVRTRSLIITEVEARLDLARGVARGLDR